MRRLVAGACLLLIGRVAAADLTHFYCYAPDPGSGTVFVSTVLPVGPVAERGRYGAEFVDHLKKSGRVRADVTAYCVMRDGAATLARARAALPMESCSECGGITRFADVAWTRNGVALPTEPIAPSITSELHDRPASSRPPEAPSSQADFGPILVVMGNRETGKLLVLSHQPNLEKAASQQAKAIRATGWIPLVSTRDEGFGAAMCVHVNDETHFFTVHGKENARDAIRAAREQADAFAGPRHAEVRPCGAPWVANAEPLEPRDTGPIDYVKGKVREWVTCDPTSKEDDGTPRKCPPPSKGDAIGTRG